MWGKKKEKMVTIENISEWDSAGYIAQDIIWM